MDYSILRQSDYSFTFHFSNRIAKVVVDSMIDTAYLNEYFNTYLEYSRMLDELSWNILSSEQITEIIEDYIPPKMIDIKKYIHEKKITSDSNNLSEMCQMDNDVKLAIKKKIYYTDVTKPDVYTKEVIWDTYRVYHTSPPFPRAKTSFGIGYPIHCPACGETHIIKFVNFNNNTYDDGLKCSHCGHFIYFICEKDAFEDKINKHRCSCTVCKKRLGDIVSKIKSIEKDWINKASDIAFNILKKEEESILTNKDAELYNTYLINKNNLDKTSRFILNLKINNFHELSQIIVNNPQINNSQKNNYSKTIKKLKHYGLIYEEISYTKFGDRNAFDKNIREYFTSYLFKGWGKNLWGIVTDKNYLNYKAWTCLCLTQPSIYDELNFISSTYILNPYYFKSFNSSDSVSSLPQTKYNVLKSNAEKCVLNELLVKYSNYLVLPNYRLNEVVNVYDYKNNFNDDDFKYLYNCIVDFVIITTDGYVVKVIECQKGQHHNTEEWIHKDALKKELLSLADIPFEETF